jgi:hypothetical protein
MALTRVSRHIIDEPLELQNINATGIGTFASLRVTGDLQVDGTTTTLDTVVTEVDRLEVGANNNTVAVAVTQSGSGDAAYFMGGDVGIGTDNPQRKLHTLGTQSNTVRFENTSTNDAFIEYKGTTGTSYAGHTGNDFVIAPSSTEQVRITSAGRVGIGTVNPANTLHVYGTARFNNSSNNLVISTDSGDPFVFVEQNAPLIIGTNSTERLRITSDGKVRVPDNGKFVAGAGDDLQIYHNGTDSYVRDTATGSLILTGSRVIVKNAADNARMIDAIEGGAVKLLHNNSEKLETTNTGISVTGDITPTGYIQIDDSSSGGNLYIGDSSDLKLFHNGTNSYIRSGASNAPILFDNNSGVLGAKFVPAGAFELYHNGNKRVETTNTGASVTGNLNISGHTYLNDNRELVIGAGNDLKIYHDGSINRIRSDVLTVIEKNDSEDMASFMPDGAVVLFHNGSQKFETTTTGAKVTGALEVTQEYPSIRPTLDLNFAATKTLDRRITFTRDSVGTFTDDMGIVKYASNNTPRFDHDPTTGESLGLLIEESRTNLLTYSDLVSGEGLGTGWAIGGSRASKGSNATAPDGTLSAWNSVYNGTSGDASLYKNGGEVTTSNSTVYTLSLFAKVPSTNTYISGVRIRTFNDNHSAQFNLITGTIVGTSEGTTTNRIEAYPNGWYRCSITFTSGTDGNQGVQYYMMNSSNNTLLNDSNANGEEIYYWGAQLEAGSFATSYIPTSGSTVTRASDIAVIKGTNFTDFYNETEGTLFIHADKSETVNDMGVTINNMSSVSDNRIELRLTGSNLSTTRHVINSGGTGYMDISTNITDVNKYSFAFARNNARPCTNGTLGTLDTVVEMPIGVNQMTIGDTPSFNGQSTTRIRKVSYYTKRLPDAQLQGLTQQ